MAMGLYYVCNGCSREIEAWDDGNPYYRDAKGKKRYAYHPDPERALCIGNDSPMLCLACGRKSMSDSAAPISQCPKCASANIVDLMKLDGRVCPYCKKGTFRVDPERHAIS